MKNLERLSWIFLVSILLGFISFSTSEKVKAISSEGEAYLQILHETVAYIENDFVEPADEKKIYTGAIQGALQSLGDPHSRFLGQEEFAELQNDTKGSFGGIGVEVSFQDGAFVIISPLEGTPAWKAGLLPQDRIIEINGKLTKDVSLSDSIGMMRGEVGSSLSMKIERKGIKDPFSVNLIRELIKIQYIRTSYLPATNTGYVKLAQFMGRETTGKEFAAAVKKHIDSGAKNLVIDLRMNPGGLVDLSVELADLFLASGKEILSVRGRGGILVRTFRSEKLEPKFLEIPVVILVNGGSASASEILAGALQDNGRAKVVGTQSFGKGSVQSIFPLSHKTAVAITIQKYFTPSGKSIHGKGITPDFVVQPITATDEERFALDKLQKKGKLKPFFSENQEFNDTTVKNFQSLIEKEKLIISESVIRLYLFNELRSAGNTSAPNVELDLQLKEAIRLVQKQ